MESPKKNTTVEFEAVETSIVKWDSVASVEERGCTVFDGDRHKADQYLHAINEIQQSMESVAVSSTDPRKIKSFEIQIAMARLQDEFRNKLIAHTNQIETNTFIYFNSSTPSTSLTETTANFKTSWLEDEFCDNIVLTQTNSIETHSLIDPNSLTRSSFVTESSVGFKTTCDQSNAEGYLEDELSFNSEELGTHSHIDPNSSTRSSCVTESSAGFKTTCDQSNDEGYQEDEVSFNGEERGTHSHNDPNSLTRSSFVTESSADFKTTSDQSNDEGYLEDEVSFNGKELGEWSSISYRSSISIDDEPSEAIYNLRSIAERMITSGYLNECIQAYVSVRKPIVASNFRCLGIERLSVGDDNRLGWDAFEWNIRWWIRGAKVCVRILFAREKRLCEEIFEGEGLGTVANDACFMETVKGPVNQLFDFPKAVSNSQRSHVELYMILDLHNALTDILSDVDVLFRSNSSESIRVQAIETLSKLAEAARERLTEFENAVQNDGRTNPLFGGIIHPLTRYVMDYILLISGYTKTMKEIIVTNPSMGSWISGDPTSPEIDFPELEDQSPFSLHLIWIILILQFKLEEKSKYYKDASLSHIFLMNNVHFIIQKIKGYPKLHKIIGNDCLKKLTLKFRQAMIDYVRSTWVGILYCLRDEGLQGGRLTVKERKMRRRVRFKTFNSMFEKVHRVQASWLVPDPQLREELQISISEKLIPAYRCFLRWLRVGEDPKYSVEDLEIAVLDFFEGHQVSLNRRKRLYNFMTNQGNSNRDPN